MIKEYLLYGVVGALALLVLWQKVESCQLRRKVAQVEAKAEADKAKIIQLHDSYIKEMKQIETEYKKKLDIVNTEYTQKRQQLETTIIQDQTDLAKDTQKMSQCLTELGFVVIENN